MPADFAFSGSKTAIEFCVYTFVDATCTRIEDNVFPGISLEISR